MSKYQVNFWTEVTFYNTIIVDAENNQEAQDIALGKQRKWTVEEEKSLVKEENGLADSGFISLIKLG